jgi:hypothetical protein
MSEPKRFVLKNVNDDEFTKLIQAEIEEEFKELYKRNSVKELDTGFVQANVTLNFAVLARKPMPGQEAKSCCKCKYDKKQPNVLLCKGTCCVDATDGDGGIIIEPL